MYVVDHTTKAELFNSFNRNDNGPGEAEDVQSGSVLMTIFKSI